MSEAFVKEIAARTQLSDETARILNHVGVRSWAELHSLATGFPSLATIGVNVDALALAARDNAGVALVDEPVGRPKVAYGALPPANAVFGIAAAVALPPPGLPAFAPAAVPTGPLDVRIPNWPVRDQGQRGSCVSFGATACVEAFANTSGHYDLSERFLYWAIKTHSGDPTPSTDGTWLIYAQQALASQGICPEPDWPYWGQAVNPISGAGPGAPSTFAVTQASQFGPNATCTQKPATPSASLIAILQQGHPAAITLPVFGDPNTPPNVNVFESPVAWSYGRVLNPPPTAVVKAGHCVCVTGFVPDTSEPAGGYFILRNSWNTAWGSLNPSTGSHAPERGYGDVSASYLDHYCWEIFSF